ncbi:hypothetical protein, partial [Xanthomonas arboricola]|uniref:hypothetical protein n=1 Tax=Xanthomonas arboricola TaxID=56448 RepID=UPI0012688607
MRAGGGGDGLHARSLRCVAGHSRATPFPSPLASLQEFHPMSNTVYIGAKEYFPGIGKIGFEGRDSD